MKNILVLLIFLLSCGVFAKSKLVKNLEITWNSTIYDVLNKKEDYLKASLNNLRYVSEEEQDKIRKKIKDSINKIKKSRVVFKNRDMKHDNSIYGMMFHYNNNETMFTVYEKDKVNRYFLINDKIWRVLVTVEKGNIKKNYDLRNFLAFFTKKHGEPFKVEYDKFKINSHVPIKAYFKDKDTILEISYSSIYNSFILLYSSLDKVKELSKKGIKTLKRDQLKLNDNGINLDSYNELEYESNYSSNEDDESTKDIFEEIDNDFKKQKELSEKKRKKKKNLNKK